MRCRVFSRLALPTVLKFPRWAEEWIVRDCTWWERRSKARDTPNSERPPTIPQTPWSATLGKSPVNSSKGNVWRDADRSGALRAPSGGLRPPPHVGSITDVALHKSEGYSAFFLTLSDPQQNQDFIPRMVTMQRIRFP